MKALHHVAAIALVSFTASGTMSAQELLNDNFNNEDPAKAAGVSSLGYTAFANWIVTGNVDLVATPNNFTIQCGGKCVDLDGTAGPGAITTKQAYEFFAGDVMRFQFDVSGSQRMQAIDRFLVGFGFSAPTSISNFTSTTAVAQSSGPVSPAGAFSNIEFGYSLGASEPFSTWTYEFTAQTNGSVSLSLGTSSSDNIGPVVDNVIIARDAALPSAVVPEPASAILLGAGVLGLIGVARRRLIA